MQAEHIQFAKQSLESFIDAAIQRIAFSGENVYRYTLSASSIKEAAGLARLKASVLHDYVSFFAMMGVRAAYNESFEVLNIVLNLNDCVLTPQQAGALAEALATFRAEHL